MIDLSSYKEKRIQPNEALETQIKKDIDISVSRIFKMKDKIPQIWDKNVQNKKQSMGRILESFYIMQDGLNLIEPHPEKLKEEEFKKIQEQFTLIGSPMNMYPWVREIYSDLYIGISNGHIDSTMKNNIISEIFNTIIPLLQKYKGEEIVELSNEILERNEEEHVSLFELLDLDDKLSRFIRNLTPPFFKIEQAQLIRPLLDKVEGYFISWVDHNQVISESDINQIFNDKIDKTFYDNILNLKLLFDTCFSKTIDSPKLSKMFFERIKSNFRLALSFLAKIETESVRQNIQQKIDNVSPLESIVVQGNTININLVRSSNDKDKHHLWEVQGESTKNALDNEIQKMLESKFNTEELKDTKTQKIISEKQKEALDTIVMIVDSENFPSDLNNICITIGKIDDKIAIRYGYKQIGGGRALFDLNNFKPHHEVTMEKVPATMIPKEIGSFALELTIPSNLEGEIFSTELRENLSNNIFFTLYKEKEDLLFFIDKREERISNDITILESKIRERLKGRENNKTGERISFKVNIVVQNKEIKIFIQEIEEGKK